MNIRRTAVVPGLAGLGIALATAAPAVASPIDSWLYNDSPGGENTLPGIEEPAAPGTTQGPTVTFDHDGDPSTPWYTADVSSFGTYSHIDVTSVLDPSFGYPSVGTVADQYSVNALEYNPTYPTEVTLYSHEYISDPKLGVGDLQSLFGITNYYVSDAAGVEDQVTFAGGTPITLFDFPAADAGSADAGDALPQLLGDLFGGGGT